MAKNLDDVMLDGHSLARALGEPYDAIRHWLKKRYVHKEGRKFRWPEAFAVAVFSAAARHFSTFDEAARETAAMLDAFRSDAERGVAHESVFLVAVDRHGQRWQSSAETITAAALQIAEAAQEGRAFVAITIIDPWPQIGAALKAFEAAAQTQRETEHA